MFWLSNKKIFLSVFLLLSSKAFCVLRLEDVSPEDQMQVANRYPAVGKLICHDENGWVEKATASIVRLGGQNHILTSAHCVENPKIKLIKLYLANEIYSLKKEEGIIVCHPLYFTGKRHAYDVALIRVGVKDCPPLQGTKWLSEHPAFEVGSISYEEKKSYDVRIIGCGYQGVINETLSEVVLDNPQRESIKMAADFSARWGKREKHLGVLKSKKSFPFSHIKGRLAYGDSGGPWLLINPSEPSDPCKINDKIIGVHACGSSLEESSRRILSCIDKLPYRNLGTPITPSLKEWLEKVANEPSGPKRPPRRKDKGLTHKPPVPKKPPRLKSKSLTNNPPQLPAEDLTNQPSKPKRPPRRKDKVLTNKPPAAEKPSYLRNMKIPA